MKIHNYFKAVTFIAAIATSHHIMAMQPQKENRAPKQLTCAKEYFSKDDLQKFLETKPTEFELHQKLLDVMIERFAQYDIEMVATLLRHGAPVDLIDPDYGTPLLIAVTKQDIDAVKLILSYYPNVNLGLFHEGGRGVPPLTMSIRLGATVIAKLILAEENTVVDEIVGGYTAFQRAVEKGLNDLVPLMIKKQANLVHSKDHLTLSTPLHCSEQKL